MLSPFLILLVYLKTLLLPFESNNGNSFSRLLQSWGCRINFCLELTMKLFRSKGSESSGKDWIERSDPVKHSSTEQRLAQYDRWLTARLQLGL